MFFVYRGPKATDVKMSKRAMRAHARCLRRHGAVLTDRLERMSKPPRRTIIHLWRERAHSLPAGKHILALHEAWPQKCVFRLQVGSIYIYILKH